MMVIKCARTLNLPMGGDGEIAKHDTIPLANAE